MKLIGFRNSTTSLRYAVLELADDNLSFVNSGSEHVINYPTEYEDGPEKLNWLYDEVCRILRKNSDIYSCGIKVSEFGRPEKKATRFTAHADAITTLACVKSGHSIAEFLYSQLPTSRAKVKEYSEKLAGKTDKYWDAQIADAIAVAFAVRAQSNG